MDHWQMMTKEGFYRGGPALSSAVAGPDPARSLGPTRRGHRARPGAATGPLSVSTATMDDEDRVPSRTPSTRTRSHPGRPAWYAAVVFADKRVL
ncbi:hypothetical protein SSPO_092730 [Streptomyces antimycoticus]|uniref:Uncharacterized protein n=1 Tax=Streptomyces antimycoticus TaxID=68175 RepID=A0A499UWI0_9ACTN|nr:hypothetical protein SSPO_092730 [Streptomyces antimycoticus]